MSAPQQLEATLTIIEDEGDFTVRVGNQPNAKQISQAVVPILSGLGAKKLLLITPFDTKVFKFNGNSGGRGAGQSSSPETEETNPARTPPARRTVTDLGGMPTPEDATAEFEEFVRQEQEAERIRKEMEAANNAQVKFPADSEEEAEAVAPPRRGRPPKDKIEGATSACGRCGGGGRLEGGGQCPVCRGKGAIGKWGRKR